VRGRGDRESEEERERERGTWRVEREGQRERY